MHNKSKMSALLAKAFRCNLRKKDYNRIYEGTPEKKILDVSIFKNLLGRKLKRLRSVIKIFLDRSSYISKRELLMLKRYGDRKYIEVILQKNLAIVNFTKDRRIYIYETPSKNKNSYIYKHVCTMDLWDLFTKNIHVKFGYGLKYLISNIEYDFKEFINELRTNPDLKNKDITTCAVPSIDIYEGRKRSYPSGRITKTYGTDDYDFDFVEEPYEDKISIDFIKSLCAGL